MSLSLKTMMKTCETCETKMDHWWDDEEGLPFCSSCFKEEGGQCDGCHWDDCVLCHEEEEWCEEHEQRMWNEHGEKCGACLEKESECPGCLRSKADEEYREARCCRCDTEMCGQCYSVSPIEGDDECYCKRCAQDRLDEEEDEEEDSITEDTIITGIVCRACSHTLPPMTVKQHLNGDFNKTCPHTA